VAAVLLEWDGSYDFTDRRDLREFDAWKPEFEPANWSQSYPTEKQACALIWRLRFRNTEPGYQSYFGSGSGRFIFAMGPVRDGRMYRTEPTGLYSTLHAPHMVLTEPLMDVDPAYGFDIQHVSSGGFARPFVPGNAGGRYNFTGEHQEFKRGTPPLADVLWPARSYRWRLELGTVCRGSMCGALGSQTWPQQRWPASQVTIPGSFTMFPIPPIVLGTGCQTLRLSEYLSATWPGDTWEPTPPPGLDQDVDPNLWPQPDTVSPWCVESETISEHGNIRLPSLPIF
jgi:hypothetical protein